MLKLGGENYTHEDLKSDLLNIDEEDKNKDVSQIFEDSPLITVDKNFEGNNLRKSPSLDDRFIKK